MTVELSKIKAEDLMFRLGNASIFAAAGEAARRFSGVAYTGDPINNHPYWGTVVFDMSLIEVPDRMSILLNHETNAIIGFSDEHAVTQDGLVLGGVLSKVTEEGRMAAALSDEGFPWQMSVRLQPSRIEEVMPGGAVMVNGRTVNGPAYIFRESQLVETSFTPTGWDSGTSAIALSHNNNLIPKEDTQMSKELEDKVAQLEGELRTSKEAIMSLTDELQASREEKAKLAGDARVEKLKNAYAKTSIEFAEATAAMARAASDETVELLCSTLSLVKVPAAPVKELPQGLFGHIATDGREAATLPAHESALLTLCDQKASEFAKK
jgi:hypothetical protein